MKKICFVIPFFYKWNNYSNVKANYEYLQKLGYEVELFNKNTKPIIEYNAYDAIFLMGVGAQISTAEFNNIHKPVVAFGWSDPNLYSENHFKNCDIYCTNDLTLSRILKDLKPILYYQTACDKRHHKSLGLDKTTDILVYGMGSHKFVPDRNETVNKLRNLGFKIKVFGRGWGSHPDTFGFIEGEALSEEICRAKILLDLSNKSTAWPHRVFEGSARGTPVMTFDREDTRQMFEKNKEIFLYTSFESLVVQLKELLREENYPKTVGLNAQKRCYNDHDISIRINELLNFLKKEINL